MTRRLEGIRRWVKSSELMAIEGRVSRVAGLVLEATGLPAQVGSLCEIATQKGPVLAEVLGFHDGSARLMPLHDTGGIAPGDLVRPKSGAITAPTGDALLGRVLNGLGEPIDGKGPTTGQRVPIDREAPLPLERPLVERPLGTGIRAIDGMITLGRGQRVGIFAGSGVGKSTLLGEIVKSSEAEVAVVALIGERGREVREFLEHSLGEAGCKRSVVIAATSDAPALQRLKGPLMATAIAESFRDRGKDVLLVMDSVTRYAFAAREVGLAAGEPPATRGYPPSVYSLMPKLVERLGTAARGSITGLLTVLVEGDDLQDPVADILRSLLDGHICLSRKLAERNHYPAIDVLGSVSRVFSRVAPPEHKRAASKFRELLSVYEASRDLVEVGAYRPGANPRLDHALKLLEPMRRFLQQDGGNPVALARAVADMTAIVDTKP